MRKVLEDLYYGEIRTHDREIDMDSELGKAVGRAERCKEKLAALLEGEAKALLLRLIDADSGNQQHPGAGEFHPRLPAGDEAGNGGPR